MQHKLSAYEKIIFFLSVYVVFELYLSTVITYSVQVKFWANFIDTTICFIFIFDFFWKLFTAKDKILYIRQNWINLISSIPFVEFLRIGRLMRILRFLRVLRSGKIIYTMINKTKPFSAFTNLLIMTTVFIFLLSISFFHAEKDVNLDIKTIEDSIVWCFVTTITFSYHKRIMPLTGEGTFIYIILVIIRMVLFGTLIGVITDFFVDKEELKINKSSEEPEVPKNEHEKEMTDTNELVEKINHLEEKLNKIEHLLEEIKNNTSNNT